VHSITLLYYKIYNVSNILYMLYGIYKVVVVLQIDLQGDIIF
jgi:hypothetical protein